MREPLKLADATIVEALRAHYAISITSLAFLPLGDDSGSAAYRVQAVDGATYFLKVRTGARFGLPSLAVPRYFHDLGVPHIIAPLPTIAGVLWVGVDGLALSLYPFLDGRMGADGGLSEQHWRALGAALKQVHGDPLTPELRQILPRETFIPIRRGLMADLEVAIAGQALASPEERELAAFWRSRQDEIHPLVERADALASQLRQASAPQVVCHADLHTWNVLLGAAGELWLVDWDETILAPKERDLMFVVGGIGSGLVSLRETACFLQGYGDAAIDPWALAYYRYAWAVQDMAAYAERVFFMPELGVETRREAVQHFMGLFEPGNIVSIAFESDGNAPVSIP